MTTALTEGDVIDLGDRRFAVLRLPGHSPGSMGLLDKADGLFFTGDAIHDGTIVDDVPGSDIAAYLVTMVRLRQLDLSLALDGHGRPFDQAHLSAIAEDGVRNRG